MGNTISNDSVYSNPLPLVTSISDPQNGHEARELNPDFYEKAPSWLCAFFKYGLFGRKRARDSESSVIQWHQAALSVAKAGAQIFRDAKSMIRTGDLSENDAFKFLAGGTQVFNAGLTILDHTQDGKIDACENKAVETALKEMGYGYRLLEANLAEENPADSRVWKNLKSAIEVVGANYEVITGLGDNLGLDVTPVNDEIDVDDPLTYPLLKFYYLNDQAQVSVVQTDNVFHEEISNTTHGINNYDKNQGMLPVAPGAPVSVTTYNNADWMTWQDGSKIYARMVGWGPSKVRLVAEIAAGVTVTQSPQIVSFQNELVVVWGEDDTLRLSHAPYGLYWSDPIIKSDVTSSYGPSVSIVTYKGHLYVGNVVADKSVSLTNVKDDFSWGVTFSVKDFDQPLLDSSISLAANEEQLSLAYAYSSTPQEAQGATIEVIHTQGPVDSASVWSQPAVVDTKISVQAAPTLSYYQGQLYVVYPTVSRYLMKRSLDGFNWNTPRFEVATLSGVTENPGALVTSTYSVVPPEPTLTLLHDSGKPPPQAMDVVIISEGYVETEMGNFDSAANQVLETYQTLNPFSRLMDRINIYRINIPAREKGVNISPLLGAAFQATQPDFPEVRQIDNALSAAYFASWKDHNAADWHWQMSPVSPNYSNIDVGEDDYKINPHLEVTGQKDIAIDGYYTYDLVESLVPGFDPLKDTLIVIVDRDANDGGYSKDSIVPYVDDPDVASSFTNFHEFGHLRANLNHEEQYKPGWVGVYGNITNNADLNDPSHPWAHFFVPGESIVADPKGAPPYSQSDFWDTSLVNGSRVFNVGLWSALSTTKKGIYGPAHQCIMNHTGGTTRFDAVCTEEIVKAVNEISGNTFDDAFYHGNSDQVFVEYEHYDKGWGINEPPKDNFIAVNGQMIPLSQFHCAWISTSEICSVDVSDALIEGANQLAFKKIPGDQRVVLDTIQVVNGNGAPLPLHPITDLSDTGSPSYNMLYMAWGFQSDLEFTFDRPLSP